MGTGCPPPVYVRVRRYGWRRREHAWTGGRVHRGPGAIAPLLVRVDSDPGDVHLAALEMDEKQSMPFARIALITGFTSSPVRTKSPVIAVLPPPVGWKPMAFATPIGPAGLISIPFSVTGS